LFERDSERLELQRFDTVDGPVLVISGMGEPRSYRFASITALINFQCDMEALLLNTGWSFVKFSPDRRTGAERRTWPRLTERRRWWTDGPALRPNPKTKTKR
jgi:hypothetical protein